MKQLESWSLGCVVAAVSSNPHCPKLEREKTKTKRKLKKQTELCQCGLNLNHAGMTFRSLRVGWLYFIELMGKRKR